MTETAKKEVPIDWTETASVLKSLETRKFFGSIEIVLEGGAPIHARITDRVRLGNQCKKCKKTITICSCGDKNGNNEKH